MNYIYLISGRISIVFLNTTMVQSGCRDETCTVYPVVCIPSCSIKATRLALKQ